MVRPDGRVARGFHEVLDTTEATTQSDLFDPSREGQPFGGAGPETTTCGSTSFGKSVWYDFAPETYGGVEMIAGGFDTVITVYRYSAATAQITGVVTCRNASTGPNEELLLPRVNRGTSYTIQVAGASSGGTFASGLLDFTFRFFADRDRDDVLDASPDRCPDLPGIKAAGGCPPRLSVVPRLGWEGAGAGVRLTRLVVDHVPEGARVEARCGRCGLHQVVHARRTAALQLKTFVGRTLPAGAMLQIYVTHGAKGSGRYRFGAIGSYFRYLVSNGDIGPVTTRCLLPGARTPRRRCT